MTAEPAFDLRDLALAGLFESYRRDGSEAWLTTHGTSMLPLIRPGSRVLVEFGAVPEVGEVVLFTSRDRYVAHRVIARRGGPAATRLIVKGDAEAHPDRSLAARDVLGVVRAVRWPDEATSRLAGLGGRGGRLVAGVSLWSGRGARFGRRIAGWLPRSLQGAGQRSIATIARVPTRFVTAPMSRFGAERR